MGLLGGLRAGVRRFVGLLLVYWALLALCGSETVFGQQPSAALPESAGPFSAAGIGTGTRTISGLWQFHTGDDLAWAQPGFDDHGWERIPADQPWGDVGHPGLWGYAWYRREIALDPNSKQSLALLLPPLDSTAEVYWNGVKIGSEGEMPPHPSWLNIQQPVAVPIPAFTGASSGLLAIRMWAAARDEKDAPDASGLQGPLQLGSRSLIEKMPDAWAEHRLRTRMISNVSTLLLLITSIAALALWMRSRSQWVLLFVGLYFGGYVGNNVATYLLTSPTFSWAAPFSGISTTCSRLASMGLVLLVADLPRRSGVRGFRFWARACLAVACLGFVQRLYGVWENLVYIPSLFTPGDPPNLFDKWGELYGSYYDRAFPLFLLTLLAVCLILSRRTLPRVLFMAAVALDTGAQYVGTLSQDNTTRFAALNPILMRPLLQIYGSSMSLFTASRLLVLVAVVYAVWDQLSQRFERQRFVDAEMKAAREIQQVLVPAAEERQAPGYAVHSVYRPASEVGGDFFQIIPLGSGDTHNEGTLIVAGDVSGKGLRAAMTVSLVVGALRTLAEVDPSPATVLAGLNRRLLGRTQGGFVTCCAVRIDAAGRATMANAGHCQPYLDGHEVELPNGLPLVLVEDAEYEEITGDVSHGQQLTLLSDGVVEARNHHGELYGFDRLNRLMQQRPTAEHVANTAVSFGQDDDITVLTVTRLAAA